MLDYQTLKNQELFTTDTEILVAYSGGLDSSVLLHYLTQIFGPKASAKIQAIHINHKINPQAQHWVQHCQETCRALAIHLTVRELPTLNYQGQSIEALLRKLRYQIFAELLRPQACLVTAHHADDQAETLLLNLLRGSGPQGLTAMVMKRPFATGYLIRPFLNCTKADLYHYAHQHDLHWIEDDSNASNLFNRNYLRHQILPLLKKRWPGAVKTLNRTSRLMSEASQLIDSVAATDLSAIADDSDLNLEPLKKLAVSRQKNVIRLWLRNLQLPTPSETKIQNILNELMTAKPDANPLVTWHGTEIRRFGNRIYAMPPLASSLYPIHALTFVTDTLLLPNNLGRLTIDFDQLQQIDKQRIRVTFRSGGEKIYLPKRGKQHHNLKKLMQEWKIPPWLRAQIPLVYLDQDIVAVVGYYCADWLQDHLHVT